MLDQKFCVIGTYEAGPGKMCQCTAKISTSTGAITNGGRASMAKVVLLEAWSNIRFGRLAAAIAIGKAMAKAIVCEKIISSRSIGNDWRMMLVVVWCVVNDWPRFPWRT